MMEGAFTTPRPVPGRLAPTLASGAVVVLALPIFAIAGWPLAGWGLAAVLWAAGQAFGQVLARLPLGATSLASSGMRGFGTGIRAFLIGIPLVAVTVTNEPVGISAAILYALVYTVELVMSLIAYFGEEAQA